VHDLGSTIGHPRFDAEGERRGGDIQRRFDWRDRCQEGRTMPIVRSSLKPSVIRGTSDFVAALTHAVAGIGYEVI
jgi:hypothetical protein